MHDLRPCGFLRGRVSDSLSQVMLGILLANQVVHVLGRDGDAEQFVEFNWPRGCSLRISTFMDGHVVSVNITKPKPIEPRLLSDEQNHLRVAVAAEYLKALTGIAPDVDDEEARKLSSWLLVLESWMHCSARDLLCAGGVRVEVLPLFSIELAHPTRSTVRMAVKSDALGFFKGGFIGRREMTLQTTGALSHLLVEDFLRALCAMTVVGDGVTCMKELLDKFNFGAYFDTRHHVPNEGVVMSPGNTHNFLGMPTQPRTIDVTPCSPCAICGSLIHEFKGHIECKKSANEFAPVFTDVTVCQPCMSDCKTPERRNRAVPLGPAYWHPILPITVSCGRCKQPPGSRNRGPCSAPRKLRLWGVDADATLHPPTNDGGQYEHAECVVYTNVAVRHGDADYTPGPEYYEQCLKVPRGLRSVWQQMACDAGWVKEMLLSVIGAGSLKVKLTLTFGSDSEKYMFGGGGHLCMLPLPVMHLILVHVMRAVLPPSREQLSRKRI